MNGCRSFHWISWDNMNGSADVDQTAPPPARASTHSSALKKVLHPIPHIQQNKNPQFFHIKKIWGFHLWPKGRKLPETVSSSFGLPKPKYIYVFIKWAEVAVKCRLKLDTNQGPTMLKTLSKHWFWARKRLITVIDISPSQTPRHKTADWRTRVL